MVLGHPYFSAYASRDRVLLLGIYHSVFEKFRFQLVSVPRVLKFILKVRFQNFQNKSPLIQRGEARTLGKFCDPLVSKYDICLIIQEHRLVEKPIRSCNRYGLQIARNGNITGVLVNSCLMKQSCKVS